MLKQSDQDDLFDEIVTNIQANYLCLMLKATKTMLSEEETYIFDRAARVLALFPGAQQHPRSAVRGA